MATDLTLQTLVDLARYPIDDPDGAGAALIESCRQRLEDQALCLLPTFLLPAALQLMLSEVEGNHRARVLDRK